MKKNSMCLLGFLLMAVMMVSLFAVGVFAEGTVNDVNETASQTSETLTWKDGDVIDGITISKDVTINVSGTVTVNGTIRLDPNAICNVVFNGSENAKLIRGEGFTGQMFYAEGTSANFQKLTFNNITLDGGAVWTGDVDKTLNRGTTNSGVKATGSVLYLVYANATLENDSVLQNHDDSTGEKANAVFLRYYSTFTVNDSIVRNNNSISTYYRGGVVTIRQGGTVKTNNADVYGNSGPAGGFVGISSTGAFGGIVEVKDSKFHNNYADNGAVFLMQCNSKIGYLSIEGCEFYENASKTAVLTEWAYSRPFIIKDSYFHDNECAVWDCNADPVLDLSGKIVVEEDADYTKYLFETPLVLGGALADGSSIAISEASLTKLLSTKAYVVTGTADYAITNTDLAKFVLPEGYKFLVADVNFDGIMDAVPVDVDFVVSHVTVTLKDSLDADASETRTVIAGLAYDYGTSSAHTGFTFTSWQKDDGKAVNAPIAVTSDSILTAQWKLANPSVAVSVNGATLTATISNANEDIAYTYQWYIDGTAIDGATADTYTMTDLASHKYRCTVTASYEGYKSTSGKKEVTASVPAAAQIGDVKYETLAEAIAAANAADGATTVTLLADVTLSEKLTITGDVTIEGAYTITRGDAYTGTLFTVNAGATLTLDGGLTIDGGNNWAYTVFPPVMDLENGSGTKVADHITPAEGGVNATAHMIVNNGTLNVHSVTIENSYSTGGFSLINAGANSVTILDGATIRHTAANRSGAVANIGGIDAILTIKGTTRITDNFGIGNGGIIQNYGQGTTVNLEGGSIDNNFVGSSGTLYASYSNNANKINTFNMTGGIITKNVMEGYGPVYIHTNTVWNMSGGEISENVSYLPSYVRNNNPAGTMTGGKIVNNEITGLDYGNSYYVTRPDLRLNGKTAISGGTFTQDVSEWLAPNTGLVYNEATGTYTTTQAIWEMHLTDANGDAHWLSPMTSDTLSSILSINKVWYDSLQGGYSFTLKLLCDVKVNETGIVNFPLTIDLNGYTVTGMNIYPVIRVQEGATVTVTGNGSIVNATDYVFVLGSSDQTSAGYLTIENGTFVGQTTVASVTKGILSVNGGTFKCTASEYGSDYMFNCVDANYKNGTAQIVVKGGTFVGFDPMNNAAEGAGTNFCSDGHIAEELTEGYFTVRKANYVAEVNGVKYETLQDAINACTNGETVKLIADIIYTNEDIRNAVGGATGFGKYPNPCIIDIGGKAGENGAANVPSSVNAILDLNGHTITSTADAYLFMIMDNAKLTFTDSSDAQTGKVITTADAPVIWVIGTDTLVTVEGGFYQTASATGLIHVTHGGDLVVNGGEFKTTADDASLLIMLNTKDRQNAKFFISGKATVTIKGGTFHGFNPAKVGDDNGATSIEDIKFVNGCAEGFAPKANADGSYGVVKALAEVNGEYYASLADALAAAKAGDTITFLADITENVEITKAVTINGAGKTYTGKMTLKADTTIKNVNFDGKGYNGYAVETRGANYLTIEDCTAKNYGYGFVQLASGTALTTIKNVTVSNVNYGVKVDYSNAVVLENVDITAYVAVYNSNYGEKTITIKDSYLNNLVTWKRNETTKTTYVFEGENTIDEFITYAALDSFKLADVDSTLTAPEGQTVTTDVEGYEVVYEEGVYKLIKNNRVTIGSVEDLVAFGKAVTGNTLYQGVKVAANPDVIVLLTADLDLTDSGFAPMGNGAANAFSGTFDGQGHTISNMTLICDYYRGVGFFRSLGKGATIKDLTFVNADVNNGAATGANHFYGVVAGFSNNVTLDNVDIRDSKVTCKYTGSAMIGCLEGTSTIKNCDIKNVILNTTSIRGAVYGILGNSASGHTAALENNTVNNVVFIVDGEIKAVKETLKYNEWADGTEYTKSMNVAQIGDTKYASLADAIAAAEDGDTITLIGDVTRAATLIVDKDVTIDFNDHTVYGSELITNAPVIRVLAEVTVKNGAVDGRNGSSCYAFIVGDSTTAGSLTIVDGKYYGGVSAVSVTNGTLTVEDGYFEATEYNGAHEFTLNCIDSAYNNGNAVIVVKGGSFYGFNPENNAAEGANTNFVAEDYGVNVADSVYTVVKAVVEMDGKYYATIKDALATLSSADTTVHTVKVLQDHDIDVNYSTFNYPILVNGFSIVLDLNGKTINVDWSKYAGSRKDNALIGLANGGKLTVTGNGTINNLSDGKDDVENRIFWLSNAHSTKESVLTIENGTFNQYEDINLLYVEGLTASSTKKGYFTYIKGGEFNMLDPNFTDFFNSYDGRKQETVLTGGIFSHDPTDPELKIHEDFRVRALSNGKWKVVPLVTVVFDDFTIVDGNELPEFTYTTNFNDVAEDGAILIVPNPVVNVNGADEYDITSDAYVFMSEDYVVEVIPGTLTVQKAALSVDGVFFTDLASAIPSIKRNSVIKLYDDIEYGKTVVDGSNKFVEFKLSSNLGDLVIDLNGHDLTFHFSATIQFGTTLTIKDSSGVPGTIRNTNGAYPFVINPKTVVNLVDGVNFDCTIQMNCTNKLSGYFQIDGKNVIGETDSLFVAGNSYIRLALKQNYLYVETIAGTLTLAEDWKTLAGQTVIIRGSTGITVAEGVTLTIDPTTNLTLNGYLNGEGTVVVNTLEHFEQIMATDIKNIEIGSTIVLSEDYVLDLAGKKITSSEGVNPAFRVTDGAKVTVKNADMDTAGYAFILGASDGSTDGYLTIENGKFHSVITVVSVTKGKLTVLDGEFSAEPYNGNYAYLFNCIDANYRNGTASIEISGGIFHNWDPENNAAEGKNTNFVADLHASVEIDENVWKVVNVIDVTVTLDDKTMVIGNAQPEYTYTLSDAALADVIKVTFNAINVTAVGTYDITATVEADSLYNVTVVKATLTVVDAVAQIGSANFASLRDALASAEDGDTIVILKDHAMDGTDVVNDPVYGYDNLAVLDGKAVTLDFNGHTVSVQPDCDANDDNALKNCLESVIFVANGGSLTVTDTVGNGGFYVTKGTNLYSLIYNSEGSTVTVKNGNFYIEETVQNGAVIYVDANNTTSIEGGNFTLVNAGSYDNTKPWITNVEGKNSGNFVQVTGGTFNQDPYLNRFTAKDWEVNVPENFAVVDNGNGTWSVVPAVVYIEEDYIPGYKTGYATLADALAAVENGETIVFVKDFSENVTIKQKKDLSFTINGNGKTFGGTITIDGASRSNGEETLTITNVNFLAETEGQSSIITKKSSFAHNVTIDGCTFTGTDAQNVYGITLQHAYDITLKNVTASKLLDLVYGKSAVTGFVAENVTVTEAGTGFWFTSVKGASFKNVNVKAANAIGVKNAMSSTMTFENCSFEAEIPVYVWLSTADVSYSMVFNGTNSMVATKGGSWLVINETKSAGFKVTLNDTGLDAAGIDSVVAMIGDNVYYNSVAYAVKDAQDGETVVVIADDTSAKDIIANNNVTLDLNGFDVTGNLTVNGNLTIKDSTVDEAAKNYDDAGHLNGTVTVADGATLTLYAGIYNQNVDEYCADHYLARDNKNGTWTVCRGVVFNMTYGTSFMTIADAMANAMTTAGKDHIVLLEDHFENIVIVYDNTILDLGTFDLTTNYVIVFKGGNLTGNTYSSTKDHGKLIVAQRDTNVIFDGEGYVNAKGYTVLPTWDAEQGCYVFSYFAMTTTDGNRGYKYDVDNDTARVTFKIQSSGSAVKDLLLDGIANHGINIVLTVTCKKDGNAVTQDYVYSDELLKKCFSTTDNLTFQLGNVSSLTDVTFEIKVVSETGAYQSGGVVTLAECQQ